MSVAWQMIIVTAIVLWAAASLFFRIRRLVASPASTACSGGCQGCPSDRLDTQSPLLQLAVPERK